jgi:hypothetical protein
MHSTSPQTEPTINLRVAGRVAGQLTAIARREGNSASSVARRLIADGLDRQQGGDARG